MMSVSRAVLASVLALLLFLFSFNAYACLVPIYGGLYAMKGSDCSQAGEAGPWNFCEHFKTLAVQTAPDQDQATALAIILAVFHPVVTVTLGETANPHTFALPNVHAPPSDILTLISTLRI